MPKSIILFMNIVIGIIFGIILLVVVWLASLAGIGTIEAQSIIGFLFTSPLILIMWIQTYKVNDKPMLYLGGPILSVSVTLTFYFLANTESISFTLYKETPYVLLGFVFFYSLLQAGIYFIEKREPETKNHDKIWTGYPMEEPNETKQN